MLKKIADSYMELPIRYMVFSLYLLAAISATILVPSNAGMVLWAWGAGASLIVGPWMWSLNKVTRKHTGKSLWDHG